MKKQLTAFCGLAMAACMLLSGCNTFPEQGSVEIAENEKKIVSEILSEKKNEIVTVGSPDENFKLFGVSEDETSSRIANKKYELNLDTVTEGNVYDPSEVDIYGQFVSPSGELYEMPAFWFADHNRYFDAYDLSGEFDLTSGGSYFAQNSAKLVGVIDDLNGEEVPVGKITFDVKNSSDGGNAGAVISKGNITAVHDTVSVWLKAGENLDTTGLYLYFYGDKDQAYVKLPQLTEEWEKYTFRFGNTTKKEQMTDENGEPVTDSQGDPVEVEYLTDTGDFTHNDTKYPRPIKTMYSARIQTSNGLSDRHTAVGDVYISDMQFYNSKLTGQSVQLASFVCDELKGYRPGDLFGNEVIEKKDEANFKLRFRFTEPGEWTYRIVGEKKGEVRFKYTSSVTASENPAEEENKGIIRVEPTLKRNFVFEDGSPYLPLGMNVAYSVDAARGSYDYEVYFPKMAAAGMNYSRTWLTDIDAGYGVQSVEGGILNFDARQYKAYQFDKIIELAEEYGLYLQIPMQAISAFRKDDVNGERSHRWDTNPYNVLNGGYLEEPWEYFTDARAMEDTKKLYRYYIARFGYSRNILAWELMNEIGMDSTYYGTELLSQEEAMEWADEIGSYMHAADPYDHLVTVSSGNDHYDKVYAAESVDFMNFHSYVFGSNYSTSAPNECYALWQHFGKPVLIGEMGASGTSEAYNHDKDPYGLMNKQTAFSAGMGGGAGGAMTFWWQQVNNYDQYSNWTPASNLYKLLGDDFVSMASLVKENYKVGGTNSDRVAVYGYISDDAVYAYLTDTQYNYANTNPGTFSDTVIEFFTLSDGAFTLQIFDTKTGTVKETRQVNATGGKLSISLDAWSCDIALIIDKA